MKLYHILLLGVVIGATPACRTEPVPTQTDPHAIELLAARMHIGILDFIAPRAAFDVVYCSSSFLNKNGRWPNNFAELSSFIEQSNGYLFLSNYGQVNLNPRPDDSLEIIYLKPGQTNEHRFILPRPLDRKPIPQP